MCSVARRAVALLCAAAATACNGLFYFPSRAVHAPPEAPVRDVALTSADGTRLHGWFFPAKGSPPRATFVQFHGNAGNVTSHQRSLAWVVDEGYDLFTFDYRGYGASDGIPTPRGVHEDALAAIACARGIAAARETDLVLYGQSLGGAVLLRALADAGRDRVRAVVIEGSFHSYQEIAASILWRIPVLFPFSGFAYWWVSDEYSPAPHVASVAPVPLLVVHGTEDPVIPQRFGVALYELAKPPKAFLSVPGGRHIDAMTRDDGRHRAALLGFVEDAPRARAERSPIGAPRTSSRAPALPCRLGSRR